MRIPVRTAVAVLATLLLATGAVLAWRALQPGPTDEERIRTLLTDAARAAQEKRVAGVMEAVSERFQGQGLDRAGLKQLVAFHALRGSWNAVVPLGIQVEVQGDAARAVAEVLLARGAGGEGVVAQLPEDGGAWRIEASLAREKEGWRVVGARWQPMAVDRGR